MRDTFKPEWSDLSELVGSAAEQVTVFTPFYSVNGIRMVSQHLQETVYLQFWTRLSLRDWALGVADPPSLAKWIAKLSKRELLAGLFVSERLHSKAYFADESAGFLGSANLTDGGFRHNIEIMIRVEGEDAATALRYISFITEPRARRMSADQFVEWVRENEQLVRRAKSNYSKNFAKIEDVDSSIRSSLGLAATSLAEPVQDTLQRFVHWLVQNRDLPGAGYLVHLHEDRITQRRQGHVKQTFAAVYRFFQEHPQWLDHLATAPTNDRGIYAPVDHLLRDWATHLAAHSNDHNELYSYQTLRAELRPNLGGTMNSPGGGASGTLKRMFPLVARYILARPPLSS